MIKLMKKQCVFGGDYVFISETMMFQIRRGGGGHYNFFIGYPKGI